MMKVRWLNSGPIKQEIHVDELLLGAYLTRWHGILTPQGSYEEEWEVGSKGRVMVLSGSLRETYQITVRADAVVLDRVEGEIG